VLGAGGLVKSQAAVLWCLVFGWAQQGRGASLAALHSEPPIFRLLPSAPLLAVLILLIASGPAGRAVDPLQTPASSTPAAASEKTPSSVPIRSNVEQFRELTELGKIVDAALGAYNSRDWAAFTALFATDSHPKMNEHTVKALYEGLYMKDLGKFVAKRLVPAETAVHPACPQMVYVAAFEKRNPLKLSANFVQENGEFKLVQLRFEKS